MSKHRAASGLGPEKGVEREKILLWGVTLDLTRGLTRINRSRRRK